MATDDRDDAAGAVRTQTDTDAPADGGLPRLSLDDLRLRLDSPLFARDPGLTPAADVPRLKELTWEHVVNPASRQPTPAETQPTDSTIDVDAEVSTTVEAPPAVVVPPRPSIEDLLSERRPTAPASPPPAPAASPEPPAVDRALASTPEPLRSSAHTEPSAAAPPVEEAFLQIAVPRPAPRAADPVLDGLAALIVGTAPAEALPATPLTDELTVEPAPVKAVQIIEPEPAAAAVPAVPEPVVTAGAEVATDTVADAEPAATGLPDVTTVQPVTDTAGSTVEAELNRLAFLPDQDDEVGPVEVPPIAVGEPPARTAPPLPGNLTLASSEVYAPRSSAAPVNRRSYADLVAEAQPFVPPQRKRKRHFFRNFLTLLLVLGLVGGGLFALKHYLLGPQWAADVKPLASEVETQRGLTFDHAVKVSTLPVDEYAVELSQRSLGLDAATLEQVSGEWRALGLLSGVVDARAIGMAAIADSPAFYDPSSTTIYVLADLPAELRTFALHRALTLALLDQQFGWGGKVADAAPALVRGTRALFDADALETAQAMLTPTDRTAVIAQILGLYSTYTIPSTPSPFATVVSGRLGLAMWPYFRGLDAAQRQGVERYAIASDAQVLDLRRLVTGAIEQIGPDSQGMLFWYHVLAARIDDDLAWQAALSWSSDRLTTATGAGGQCVTGVFESAGPGSALVASAFQQWAAAAPAESQTKADVAGDGATVTVTACDPGANVATNDGGPRLSLGGAPLRSEQFRHLLEQQPALSEPVAACAVYRTDPVSMSDERSMIDGPDGWSAPAAHPAPDPATNGCGG